MQLPYEEFMTFPRDSEFDWSSDGCSTPWYVADEDKFDSICRQHDFGYRNFGGRGLRLSPTEETRKMIDDRLFFELHRLCTNTYRMSANPFGLNDHEGCLQNARLYHIGVRERGAEYFF